MYIKIYSRIIHEMKEKNPTPLGFDITKVLNNKIVNIYYKFFSVNILQILHYQKKEFK